MPNSCSIKLEGHLAKDPIMTVTANKKTKAAISVAHNPGKKEDKKPPVWFNLIAYNEVAEQIRKLKKGDAIYIESASPDTWTTGEGKVMTSWVIWKLKEGKEKPAENDVPNPKVPSDEEPPF